MSIEIKNLTKEYRAKARALDGVDFVVDEGELLALVGPSGSGKTTLLRLIAGLDQPTSGSVRIGGRDMKGVPPHRRNVSLVFQNLALYSHLTVRQNLTFGLDRGVGRQAGSLPYEETAELLEIGHLLNRYPAELSGGEQQRVALGRAIVRRPAALLLDEPLSSVDGPLRRSLRRLVKDVQRRLGVPTIYVTHDPAEALWLGDRVAVLQAGKLIQVGPPEEICRRPGTDVVGDLFTVDEANLKMQSFFEQRALT
jgi:multiple sugar transport system ATP-binding protein